MDAIKFIEEKRRMCAAYGHCRVCPALRHKSYCIFSTAYGEAPLEQIKFLEKGIEEHPRKTRQSVFLEHYPEAEIINDALDICPMLIDKSHRGKDGVCAVPDKSCSDCMRDFWEQEDS